MKAKVYSVEEANRVLPSIRRAFLDAKRLRREIAAKSMDYEFMQIGEEESSGNVARTKMKSEIDVLIHEFRLKVGFLENLGVQIKQFDPGIVDFFTIRDGCVAFLCWKEGETSVRYWHHIDGGFAERQPL